MNILEQFRHILMGNICVFMKIKLWIKQEVNRNGYGAKKRQCLVKLLLVGKL